MSKTGRINGFKSGLALHARGLWLALPAKAREVLTQVNDFGSRRRRTIAFLAIIAFHVVTVLVLATVPPPPIQTSLVFLDLSSNPGEAAPSAIGSAPTPPQPLKRPATTATHDGEIDKKTTVSPKPDAKSETSDDLEVTAIASPTDADAQDTAAAEPATPSSADVLAMVEALTGSTVTTVARSQGVAAPVTRTAMAEIRERQAHMWTARNGGGCAIDAALKEGFTNNPDVQAELSAIPASDKSVSNALQLWAGDWTSQTPTGTLDPLVAVRALTIEVVETAPANCRNGQIQGPRFIIVPVSTGTEMVIVIGSGAWRWRDVLPQKTPVILRWLSLGR